jgi:hypothetical protein
VKRHNLPDGGAQAPAGMVSSYGIPNSSAGRIANPNVLYIIIWRCLQNEPPQCPAFLGGGDAEKVTPPLQCFDGGAHFAKLKGAYGPSHGGVPARAVRPWWPYGCGNRDDVYARGGSAEMSVSRHSLHQA